MKLRVLFFAVTRELAGTTEAEVVLGEGATVGDFVRHVEATWPNLAGRMSGVRIARNERFAELHVALADGDVLALVPPVSGG